MRSYTADAGIPTLETALSTLMTVDDLKRLAALTNRAIPSRKADLAALIQSHLAGERLRTVYQGLDETQQAAVAEVVHSNSTQFRADRFRAKYRRDPDWGATDGHGYRRSYSALHFFFYGSRMMPDDLKARLKAFVPPPMAATIRTLDELPATYEQRYSLWNDTTRKLQEVSEQIPLRGHDSQRAVQSELFSILRLIDSGRIAVSDKTKRASAATVEAITTILEGGDFYPRLPVTSKGRDDNAGPIRAFAWPLIVQAGGLAQLAGTKLQLTPAGRKALHAPLAETIRTLWTKWQTTTLLDELARIDCVKGQTGKGMRYLTALSSRREAIVNTLRPCPTGTWLLADDFISFQRALGNDFAVTRDAWTLYLGEANYGTLGNEGSLLSARYVLAFLLEYASTLGIVDVALIPPAGARSDFCDLWGADDLPYFSRYDGLLHFRITSLGAYCLGREAEYRPAPVEVRAVLRVLPSLDVAATGPELDHGDRLALDSCAHKVSHLLWRLDAGKLLIALDEGGSLDDIRQFLTSRSGDTLPDTVARLLDEVAERSARVQDRGLARLVECDDPALAVLIADDPRTRRHCLRAGERHLVIPGASENAFRRGLRELGYLLAAGAARPARSRGAVAAKGKLPAGEA